jgi:hypothetical protein
MLQSCAGDVVRDILAKSGVTRYQASPYGEPAAAVAAAVTCTCCLALI